MTPTTTKRGGPVLRLSELRAFDPSAKERSGESRFCCPLRHPLCDGKPIDEIHRSLTANLTTGTWRCHRCDQSGLLREFWTELTPATNGGSRRRASAAPRPLTLPPLASRNDAPPPELPVPIADRFSPLAGTPGEAYLAGRGLPLALCEAAGVCFAENWHGRPAVLFPILDCPTVDRSGQEVAAQGRYLHPLPGKLKFLTEGPKKLGVFVSPGAWDACDLTITEAPIDALSLYLSGYPAIALVGKTWPDWLPPFLASRRKRVYLAFDADEPDSKGIRAGDDAASKLAEALRYYACRSERLRPVRAKDWNAQLLEVSECRRLNQLFVKQLRFLEEGKTHPTLSRSALLTRAEKTLHELGAACRATDGLDAIGYEDGPLDPFAVDCLPLWEHSLNALREEN